MSTDKLRAVAVLAAVLVVVPAVVGQTQTISVLVDGQPLITSAPPVESGGRIMVGMRDIFERLGAEVKWNAANQQITATRGMRTVVLWIGQPYSTVDGAMLPLDVPPQLINGSTYVPVRFPSEALGANVTWMSATRTVMISTASMPALDDTTEPELPPPSAAPTTANGIFRQVISAAPPAIIVAPYDGSAVAMHPLTPTAIIQRGAAEAPALHLVALNDILPGDDVTLELNDEGQGVRVEARHLTKTVVFQAVAANKLLAQDGSLYQLSSDVTLTRTDAGPITLADLRAGEELTLRLNPVDEVAWDVVAPATEEPPPPPAEDAPPQILLLAPEDYTRALREGETLKIRLEGTPGGTAVWDLGGARRNLQMSEVADGVYHGKYDVKAGDQLVDQTIRGRLTVEGDQAEPAEAEVRVSLDALAPTVTSFLPASDSTVPTNQPTIQVTYDDSDGTGIDVNSVKLRLNNMNATNRAIIDEQGLTLQTQALKVRPQHEVQVTGADLAGNEFELTWRFKVAAEGPQAVINSVTHVPPGAVLGRGDILTVTLRGQPGGKSASFDIAGLSHNIPMDRQGGAQSSVWSGSYKVQVGDKVTDARITGRFVDAANATHLTEDQQRVTIDAAVQTRLEIAEPADGATVPDTFKLAGTGIPDRTVTYTVTYTGRSKLLNAQTTGQVATGQVTVEADGTWSVDIDTGRVRRNPLLRRIDQFEISCVLKGRGGAVVGQADITVTP